MEKDSGGKLASLPPAKLNFSAKVTQIATGLQHTLLLTIHGEVFAFGSNNYGQLGLLDLNPRGIPTPVDLTPRGLTASKVERITYRAIYFYENIKLFRNGLKIV